MPSETSVHSTSLVNKELPETNSRRSSMLYQDSYDEPMLYNLSLGSVRSELVPRGYHLFCDQT